MTTTPLYQTVKNIDARKDSHAPDTVAAWDDHFIVQTKPPAALLWSSANVTTTALIASRRAAEQPRDLLVRIVKPSRVVDAWGYNKKAATV